jgi:hypothetical protein
MVFGTKDFLSSTRAGPEPQMGSERILKNPVYDLQVKLKPF